MDKRRYVDSIIAGIRIYAHKDFRLCITMNSDSSTFEVPEYILSRIQPSVLIEFPNKTDELKILKYNLPFASEEILDYCVGFLQNAHIHDEPYTVRDGISILSYYMKLRDLHSKNKEKLNKKEFKECILHVLDPGAIRYCPDEYGKFLNNETIKKNQEELF
jgi:hypothetical protein